MFPEQEELGDFTMLDELTEFRFTADHTAWSTPANCDSVEHLHTETPLTGAGFLHEWQEPRDEEGEKLGSLVTPLTVRIADDLYLALHEAAPFNYPGMTCRRSAEDPTCAAPWCRSKEKKSRRGPGPPSRRPGERS